MGVFWPPEPLPSSWQEQILWALQTHWVPLTTTAVLFFIFFLSRSVTLPVFNLASWMLNFWTWMAFFVNAVKGFMKTLVEKDEFKECNSEKNDDAAKSLATSASQSGVEEQEERRTSLDEAAKLLAANAIQQSMLELYDEFQEGDGIGSTKKGKKGKFQFSLFKKNKAGSKKQRGKEISLKTDGKSKGVKGTLQSFVKSFVNKIVTKAVIRVSSTDIGNAMLKTKQIKAPPQTEKAFKAGNPKKNTKMGQKPGNKCNNSNKACENAEESTKYYEDMNNNNQGRTLYLASSMDSFMAKTV